MPTQIDADSQEGFLATEGTENTEGRKRIRHRLTLIHTAGRELLAENGGQTMEDGRQKRRLKIKILSPDFLVQCPWGRASRGHKFGPLDFFALLLS
jgi:hypothetical protein